MDANDRRSRAAQEAAEWWVALQGEPSRADREQYVDWLRESAVHVAEMLRVAQVHGALSQFERWRELPTDDLGSATNTGARADNVVGLPPPESPERAPTGPPRRAERLRLAWGLAAMLLLVAGGATAWLLRDLRGQVIETQRGERRQVALADGSVVQVDPETRLRVRYEPERRRVFLEHGRALFHVAKNATRPFLVQADDTTVRAVGTAFAVEHGADTVVVTVSEGRVAVLPPHAARREPVAAGGAASPPQTSGDLSARSQQAGHPETSSTRTGGGEIVLGTNEQVTVQGSGSAEPVREVDSARALAWADGRLIFQDESVSNAIAQFNRYNRIQLEVRDPALARRTISGVFSASDPESFVAFIRTVAPVRVTRSESQDIFIEAAQ